MTNREKFKSIFGLYAEEFWAYPKDKMLDWLQYDVPDKNVGDTISRQAAIDAFYALDVEMRPSAIDAVTNMLNGLPSAQQWIPFTKRELTAEEQEEHPEWCYIMECPLPEEDQEILVSNGKWVWLDTFCVDDGCYLDSDHELEGCAWMPLPKPWKGESDANNNGQN